MFSPLMLMNTVLYIRVCQYFIYQYLRGVVLVPLIILIVSIPFEPLPSPLLAIFDIHMLFFSFVPENVY